MPASVAGLANLISGGSVLVQRLGDLMAGRRTDEKRLAQSTVRPTLNAVAGDLSLCLPKRQLDNIVETLARAGQDRARYRRTTTRCFTVSNANTIPPVPTAQISRLDGCERIYAVGDGTGFTRSPLPGGRPRPVCGR